MKDLGWHMQLWIDVKDLPDTIPVIQSIGLPVVIDHMGRTDARAGINTAGFQSLVRLLGDGGCWVKMSGAHRLSTRAPDYPDARPFHEALIAANPDQLIWGTDWPHPRIEGEMPNAGHLLDLFNDVDAGCDRAPENPRRQSGAAVRVSGLGRGRSNALVVTRFN